MIPLALLLISGFFTYVMRSRRQPWSRLLFILTVVWALFLVGGYLYIQSGSRLIEGDPHPLAVRLPPQP